MRYSIPKILLHLEGLAILVASILLYRHFWGGWGMFALFILAPDIGLLGYLVNPRIGAYFYNILHWSVWPVSCIVFHFLTGGQTTLFLISFVWLAHIGMDRTVGFGLKYPDSMKDSHLQKI